MSEQDPEVELGSTFVWGKISFWLRFSAALWAAGVAVAAVLQSQGALPDLPDLEATVWAVSLGILGVDNVGTLVVRGVRKGRWQQNVRLETAIMGLLVQMSSTGQVRFEELGGSVYVADRWNWLRRRQGHTDRIKRILRFRPSQTPQQSGISWTSVTGVVGDCWTTQSRQYKETHSIARKYQGQVLTDQQFLRVSAASRCGFSREEFNAIAGKYSEILAEPIWHPTKERKLIGLMTIDRAFQPSGDTFRAEFERQGLTQQAAITAMVIAKTLKPARVDD